MYEAKMFAYADEIEDRVIGEFHTVFDAKIACERDVMQPLQWKEYLSLDSGPYSWAEFVVGCVIRRGYKIRPVTESEAHE